MRKALLAGLTAASFLAGGWALHTRSITPSQPGRQDVEAGVTNARAALIEHRRADLIGKPRNLELTSEKALKARAAINAGDFAIAQEISAEVLARSRIHGWSFYPFNVFIGGITDLASPQYETRLDEWIAKDRNQPLPLIIRAVYQRDLAWRVRGGGFSDDTQGRHMDEFSMRMTGAAQDAAAALALDPDNPWTSYLQLSILSGNGNSDDMEHAFQQAIAKHPAYYPLYTMRMRTLEPKWGGSVESLTDFADTHAGGAGAHSPLKFLYVELYRQLIDVASTRCMSMEVHQQEDCVTATMERILPESLPARVAEAFSLYRNSDPYWFSEVMGEVLGQAASYGAAKRYANVLMQVASEATGTDTQLNEDHPGHNNYRLEAIVAQVWQREGHNDNAQTKYQEALRDIANMQFPGEEERLIAVATLYGKLAEVSEAKSRFEDAIAYQQAAAAMGGPTFANSTVACYSYFRMKDYERAFGECDSVYKLSASYDSLYWRARTAKELKKTAAAIEDFTTIADSEHAWRTSAVINLSVLLENPRQTIRMFEKYAYVFNEENRSKENLAVVYNNRCYAYKRLGELEKALADCNASLRFGSIPDALAKKRDIEKRLKLREKRV